MAHEEDPTPETAPDAPEARRARILVADHRGPRVGAASPSPGTAPRRSGARRVAAFLSGRGHRVRVTTSLRATLEALEEETPELIVLEPLVEGGRSELARLDAARAGPPLVPLLVLAERGDVDAVARLDRTLEAEAWDVLATDAPDEELALRSERLLAASALLAEMEELRHRASHDDRTDLLRPAAFEARLQEHFSAAQRHRFPLALALLDLDDFGKINKRHDHTVGDYLIARVGEVIRRSLRAEDVAGRLGGDEFAVLLPYTAKVDAAQVVRRLREEIQALTGRLPGADALVKVSTSIGFETFDGGDHDSVASLRRGAERGLRAAKRAGGDRALYARSLGAPGDPDPSHAGPGDAGPGGSRPGDAGSGAAGPGVGEGSVGPG